MRSIGIMQGRLTPPKGRGIQFFPFENWKQEFEIGAALELKEIEWIFDYERYADNPLWHSEGLKQINGAVQTSGVKVNSVCFDYFMRRPFYKQSTSEEKAVLSENIEIVNHVIDGMNRIGARLLEIPMVDDSSLKTAEERKRAIEFLQKVLIVADSAEIFVGLETDMPVGVFREFLEEIDNSRIRANYDSGNSSGLGYDHSEELHSLGEYVANVHIKDRVFHGATVALGSGNADFDHLFAALKDIGYNGSLILQAARGQEGAEIDNISSQLSFVKNYCIKYGLE